MIRTVILAAVLATSAGQGEAQQSLGSYNVVWDSPSDDCHGSMPIGNGDLAANVWVEPNGDLVFYLSKSDAWSGEQELLKLGRIRVRLDEPFVQEGMAFRQELDLQAGTIRIQSGIGGKESEICFWIDANQPVVNVDVRSDEAFDARVMLEPWRVAGATAVPDTILPAEHNTIRWYQRNSDSIFEKSLQQQHLGHLAGKYADPLMDRTFGGIIVGNGLQSKDTKTLETVEPVKSLLVRVHALTAQTETEEDWIRQIERQRRDVEQTPIQQARKKHETYWAGFWARSHIFVSGSEEAEAVTRAYVLQRWIQACAGRGAYPIKFNGSLFTVDGQEKDRSTKQVMEKGPDYRRWGGCYWFQNTRLPYWAMLYSGDYDQMKPLWKMYHDAVPLLKDRTQAYFQHAGIFCSETIYPWGLNRMGDFGHNNQGMYPTNPYIRYYWDSGIELSMMMLDYHAHTGDEEFVRSTLVPFADEVVKFYVGHYERNDEGKIHIFPSMSLETWHTAENPLPVIVGLDAILSRLLDLPEHSTAPEQRARWASCRSALPEVSLGEENGKEWIKPAHVYSDIKNSETPELYAVFPYRAYTVGKPDLETARETWRRRRIKRTGGWSQDPIQAAMIGLTDEAMNYVVQNAVNGAPIGEPPVTAPRFPAFWGPNFDWTPDQDHGSVTMIALQRMLMLCDGDEIRLLPAWPEDWTTSFKLHAPQNTILEGRVENGKVVELSVTPPSRQKDVVYE